MIVTNNYHAVRECVRIAYIDRFKFRIFSHIEYTNNYGV